MGKNKWIYLSHPLMKGEKKMKKEKEIIETDAEVIDNVDAFGTIGFIYTNKLRRIPIEPRYLFNIISDFNGDIIGREIEYINEVLFFKDLEYPVWDEYRQLSLNEAI